MLEMEIMVELKNEPVPLSRRTKLIYTGSMYLVFVAFGLSASLLAPARLDIVELTGSDFNRVSTGTSLRAAGACAGGLLFGWLYTKVNRHLGMISCVCTLAFSLFVVPFFRTLWLYYASEIVYGISSMGIDVALNAWILEIWQEAANPYMQGMHFSFGLGMALGPLYEGEYSMLTGFNLTLAFCFSRAVPFSGQEQDWQRDISNRQRDISL